MKDIFEGCSSKNPLTEDGIKYAKELGVFLKDYGIDAIYSSPLTRAKETAKNISEITGVPVQEAEQLTEVCFGSWEGKSRIELQETQQYEDRKANIYHYVYPGENSEGQKGESFSQAEKRVVPFFQKVNKETGKIVLVCHIGIIRIARRFFESIEENEAAKYRLLPDEIYIVNNGKAEIVKFR